MSPGILFLGDVHGKWDELGVQLRRCGVEERHIVQVGDFGMGFKDPSKDWKTNRRKELGGLKSLRDVLRGSGCVLHVLRGNHDRPGAFDGGNWECWPEIQLHRDYTLLRAGGLTALLVGGGVSIDRLMRREGCSYWADENVRWDPEALTQAMAGLASLDAVATHSSPAGCFPTTKRGLENWLIHDPALEADCDDERRRLGLLWEAVRGLRPRRWFHGHFHTPNVESRGGCAFISLGIMEMREMLPAEDGDDGD